MTTRRSFLRQSTAAVAAAGLVPRLTFLDRHARIGAQFPDIDEAYLCELARKAVDAARAAGASFADVRILAGRSVLVGASYQPTFSPRPTMPSPSLHFPLSFSVRSVVNGLWGFGHGVDLSVDGVTQIARAAVLAAKVSPPRHRTNLDLAPLPTVPNGRWSTPMQRDPLDVSMSELGEIGLDALQDMPSQKDVLKSEVWFEFRRPVQIFAATDGTLQVQHLCLAWPNAFVSVASGTDIAPDVSVDVTGVRKGGLGLEAMPSGLREGLRKAGDEARARARESRNPASLDVGRYDVVFAPSVVGPMLAWTLGEAMELERALGFRADSDGTSYAAPPSDVLGKMALASKLVTVRADRTSADGAATVGWDEEGVMPDAYTIVDRGVAADYHTSRESAALIADWYAAKSEPLRSHGCVRRSGAMRPLIAIPNLTLEPSATQTTVDDLIRDTKRGLYVEAAAGGADFQLISSQYVTPYTHVREIRNGKLVGYRKDAGFQYITTPFWKSVDGLGSSETMEPVNVITDQAELNNSDQVFPASTVRAVPIRARGVNVINVGRTA